MANRFALLLFLFLFSTIPTHSSSLRITKYPVKASAVQKGQFHISFDSANDVIESVDGSAPKAPAAGGLDGSSGSSGSSGPGGSSGQAQIGA